MKLALSLFTPAVFISLWLLESRWQARKYVPVKHWHWIGASFFLLIMVTATVTPLLWAKTGLPMLRVFDLRSIGWWGYPLGLSLVTFISYWWHRAEHKFDIFWRMTHQLHHSALRVDIAGAFYTHPLEVVVKSTLGILIGAVFLGLQPLVAAAVSMTTAFLAIFQHWNVRTPRWLGLFIPRPEMHGLHHEYGVHARNYADLPLWDMLFGTYVNPSSFDGRVGFEPQASARIGAMLLMRDVNNPAPMNSVTSSAAS